MGSVGQPALRPISKESRRKLGVDPLGALFLRFDMDEVFLGVDLAGKVLDRSRPVGSMWRTCHLDSSTGCRLMWAMSVLVGDPLRHPRLDVVPAEAEVFANPESFGAGVAVPPGVDGLHGYIEVVGELFDRQ